MGRRRLRKLRGKLCAYCGVNPATSFDEPVPCCMFIPPLPPDIIRVPACRECNGNKSKDDDYLRDLLAFDRDCCNHPVARHLMGDTISRSMQYNRSVIARDVVHKSEPVYLRSQGGIIFDEAFLVPLDGDRVCNALATVARGVYYAMTGERFLGTVFDVKRVKTHCADLMTDVCVKQRFMGPRWIADVFGCFLAAAHGHSRAIWFMGFYSGYFALISGKSSEKESLPVAREGL